MTIYIDLIFTENLILNFIILLATSIVLKTKPKIWKLFLASIVGSIYSILEYFVNLGKIQIIISVLISVLMVSLAFNTTKLKKLLKEAFVFYTVSLTFGGASFMFLFLVNPQNIKLQSGHFIGTYPIKMAILGGMASFGLIWMTVKLIKSNIMKHSLICEIEILYKGKNVKLNALIDSRQFFKRTNKQERRNNRRKEEIVGNNRYTINR